MGLPGGLMRQRTMAHNLHASQGTRKSAGLFYHDLVDMCGEWVRDLVSLAQRHAANVTDIPVLSGECRAAMGEPPRVWPALSRASWSMGVFGSYTVVSPGYRVFLSTAWLVDTPGRCVPPPWLVHLAGHGGGAARGPAADQRAGGDGVDEGVLPLAEECGADGGPVEEEENDEQGHEYGVQNYAILQCRSSVRIIALSAI